MRKSLFIAGLCCCSNLYAQNLIDNYLIGTPVYTVIASSSNSVNQPQDLDFKPHTNELWIVNRGNTNGGSNVIIYNAGETDQSSEYRKDSHSGHFMIYPNAIAFGDNGNFANTNEIQNTANPTSTFMGPALFSGDTSIFAKIFQNNWVSGLPLGSHLDMLHQSPFSMGIAHDSANIYWVFDGHNGNLCKYDFAGDHSPGYDDHSNGLIWRYTDVPLTREANVAGHMILDKATGWLYIVDAGTKKIKRVNTNTGSISGTLNVPSTSPEPLAGFWEVTGSVVETIDSFLSSQPCGIDLYNGRLIVGDYGNGDITVYDISGSTPSKLGTIATGQVGMAGVKIGPDGKIWFVNNTQNNVIRIDPTASVNDDIAVVSITAPTINNFESNYYYTGFNHCDLSVTPVITIKNTGSNTITSATISYKIDNGTASTYNWSGSLATGATVSVTLNAMTTTSGSHKLTVEATNANGVADKNPANNTKAGAFRAFGPAVAYPFNEDFSTTTFPPTDWTYLGHNFNNEQSIDASVGSFGSNTGSLKMDNFNGYENISGQRDYLITPLINFTNATAASNLSFAVAYAQYDASSEDALTINVSMDCGQTWSEVYHKSGAALATGTMTTSAFVPGASDWRTEFVSLSTYAGIPEVMIQFKTTSNFGNMLYVDDIVISNTTSVADNNKSNFSVYPNPAKDIVTIEGGTAGRAMSVNVYDMMGKLVKQSPHNTGKVNIDLSSQTNGTYIIKVVSGSDTHQEKITIVK